MAFATMSHASQDLSSAPTFPPAPPSGPPPLEPAFGFATRGVPGRRQLPSVRTFFASVSEAQSLENKARFLTDVTSAFRMFAHPDAVAAGLLRFVFRNDPCEDIPMLTDPEAISYTTTLSAADCERDLRAAPSALFDSEFVVDLMFIPAACHGNFSWGVVCRERFGLALTHHSEQRIVARDISVGRYCRDESTGDLFVVHNCESNGTTVVIYIGHLSSTKRLHMRMGFDAQALRGKSGNAHRFSDAARFHSVGVQNRLCPECYASPSANCTCTLSFVAMNHPRDFSAILTNSTQMIGDFVGEMEHVSYYSMHNKFVATKMFSRMRTDPKLTITTPNVLHETVVQVRLAGAVNPLALELPLQTPEGLHASTELPHVDSTCNDGLMFHLPAMHDSEFTTVGDDLEAVLFVDPLQGNELLTSEQVVADRIHAECVDNIDLAGIATNFGEVAHSSPSAGDLPEEVEYLPAWIQDGTRQLINVMAYSAVTSEAKSAAPDLCAVRVKAGSHRRPKPALSGDPDQRDVERAARMIARREKNRAAAARSNARRKVRIEEMKNSLISVREHVKVLQGREKILLKENAILKIQHDQRHAM